jgi:hypothetical protein
MMKLSAYLTAIAGAAIAAHVAAWIWAARRAAHREPGDVSKVAPAFRPWVGAAVRDNAGAQVIPAMIRRNSTTAERIFGIASYWSMHDSAIE